MSKTLFRKFEIKERYNGREVFGYLEKTFSPLTNERVTFLAYASSPEHRLYNKQEETLSEDDHPEVQQDLIKSISRTVAELNENDVVRELLSIGIGRVVEKEVT